MTRLVCSAGKLLIAATFLAFAADGSSAQPPTICDQPFDGDLGAFADRIRQLPHATASAPKDRLGLETITVRPPRSLAGAIWYFTRPDHPAHPAVSCLRIFNTGGSDFRRGVTCIPTAIRPDEPASMPALDPNSPCCPKGHGTAWRSQCFACACWAHFA